MPPNRANLKCSQCKCTESFMWKQISSDDQICYECYEKNKINVKPEPEPSSTQAEQSMPVVKADSKNSKSLRKSTRSTRYKSKGTANSATAGSSGQPNSNGSKGGGSKTSGKGRRSLFRRPPQKAPVVTATTTNVKSLFFKVMLRRQHLSLAMS